MGRAAATFHQMNIERIPIADLVEDPANARTHDAKNLRAIKGSLKRYGQQKPIVVDVNGVVIAGNGTLAAAREMGWESIDVVRSTLVGAEAVGYAISDNRTSELAHWDDDILAKSLAALDADGWDLPDMGWDDEDWGKPKDALDPEPGGDSVYSTKIESPIYEPTGPCPPLEALVDLERAKALAAEIDASELPDGIKNFLRAASWRHAVFNYEQIAEYYAHASPALQKLMERSALVIIDFDQAIELGFVALSEKLAEAYRVDNAP